MKSIYTTLLPYIFLVGVGVLAVNAIVGHNVHEGIVHVPTSAAIVSIGNWNQDNT